ncbi:MAG TPA: DMT family transporter [SAR324 cluster bacterium]|nr:DMT family transporter [SAR324 cluster bacterium]HJM07120.1 DMT family transporter [SAR324 cluster bacterium]
MIFLFTSSLFFPLGDGCAKYLSQMMPVTEVTWVRYLGNFLLLLPFTLHYHGLRGFLPGRFIAQLFRGLVLVLTTYLFFTAIQTVPIADAQIVFFINPLLVVVLAALMLREKLDFNRIVAVMVGFAGVFLVIRPGFKEFQIETLYALCAAVSFAVFLISTRILSQTESTLITLFFSALVGTFVLPFTMDSSWIFPSWNEFPFMVGVGLFMTIGHYFFFLALRHLDASLISPLTYFSIIGSTTVGYFGFGDVLSLNSLMGFVLIFTAGITVLVQERKKTTREAIT